MIPRLTDIYELGPELGRGGLGVVYEATDRATGERVAAKVQLEAPDPGELDRIRREARLAASLVHPALSRFLGLFEHDESHLALVYERIEGRPLDEVAGHQPQDPDRVLRWMRRAAEGLAVIHGAGLVYRDLKPENAMVRPDDELVLLDFGLLKPAAPGETLTRTGVLYATPEFAAPEIFRGTRADARSDLYSLGCMAYALLCGRPPFTGDTPTDVAFAHVQEDPPALVGVPEGLAEATRNFFQTALAKDPEGRHQDATALVEALERALQRAPETPGVDGPTRPVGGVTAPVTGTRGPTMGASGVREPAPRPAESSPAGPRPAGPRPLGRARVLAAGAAAGLACLAGLAFLSPPRPGATPAPLPAPEGPDLGALATALDRAARPLDEPLGWGSRMGRVEGLRPLLATLVEDSPSAAPDLDLAPLAAARAALAAAGVPDPLVPFLPPPRPLQDPELPADLGPWGRDAAAALRDTLELARAAEAEVNENPGGPYPGDITVPLGGRMFAIEGVDLWKFLPIVSHSPDNRRRLAPWLAPGVRSLRRMLASGVRALDASEGASSWLANQIVGRSSGWRVFLISYLATAPVPLLVGRRPTRPWACLVLAEFLEQQATVRTVVQGSPGPAGDELGLWLAAAEGGEAPDPWRQAEARAGWVRAMVRDGRGDEAAARADALRAASRDAPERSQGKLERALRLTRSP